MRLRNVIHKGLRRFIEFDDHSRLPPASIEKLRNILSFLQDMRHIEELRGIATWRAHQLTGDRKGTWSLSLTRNWRITFRVDVDEGEIVDVNLEDYH